MYVYIDYIERLLIKWKTTVLSWQSKEAEDTLQKQLHMQTTLMT